MRISDWSSDVCSSDLNVKKAICHPGGAEGSEGARDSTAMIVIIGTIARSWNSRIEKAFSPKGELIRPELLRPGSTCAVDDSASGRPSASDAAGLNPSVRWMSAVSTSRSEEHTSELQSLMRISYAVFCLKKKNTS